MLPLVSTAPGTGQTSTTTSLPVVCDWPFYVVHSAQNQKFPEKQKEEPLALRHREACSRALEVASFCILNTGDNSHAHQQGTGKPAGPFIQQDSAPPEARTAADTRSRAPLLSLC